jgi:hypothetical protein
MEQFSILYIEKCIRFQEEVGYLIDRSRGMFADKNNIELPKYYFRIGDYFHCLDSMKLYEYKEAKSVDQVSISSGISPEYYPIEKCIIIPTESQLLEGLAACSLSVGFHLRGKGPEVLLDWYLERVIQSKRK